MTGQHKSWSEKIELSLGELEKQVFSDKRRKEKEESWPRREQVEAWTAEREKHRVCGQYCGGRSQKETGKTKKEREKEAFWRNIALQAVKSAAFVLAMVALIQGVARVLPESITVSNTVGGRELPIYCVQTEKPQIALSFDAAWGNEDTAEILEILKKHNVKVTFFMTGGWVESYPDDVKAILADGHDLGNHSENHKNMSELSDAEIEEELMTVHNKVLELTGYEMFLFRPPYGDYDNDVIKVAKKCGYYPIQWDVDTLVIIKGKGEYLLETKI
jgi:hypothetical protein